MRFSKNINFNRLEFEFIFSISQSKLKIASLELDTSRLHTSLKELKILEQHLRDEYQALQITCAALEDKLRKAQVYLLLYFFQYEILKFFIHLCIHMCLQIILIQLFFS